MPHARLLIADQDLQFADLLQKYLEGKTGISTECCCGSGEEIISRIARTEPDIVVQALIFDGLDGFKVLEYMKGMRKRPSAIVCTNFRNDTMIIRARNCGARYFFCKPVYMPSLYDAIIDCLARPHAPKIAETRGELIRTPLYIEKYLNDIGVSKRTEGYKLLCSAVRMAQARPELMRSMSGLFYPELAKQYASTPSRVERNIRSCLTHAFAASTLINARLSNKEFIQWITENLRSSIE